MVVINKKNECKQHDTSTHVNAHTPEQDGAHEDPERAKVPRQLLVPVWLRVVRQCRLIKGFKLMTMTVGQSKPSPTENL